MKQLLMIFSKSSQPLRQLKEYFNVMDKYSCDKFVFYDEFIPVNEIWESQSLKKYIQLGTDKTEKIMNAFIKGFLNNYDEVVMADNTSPDLVVDHIQEGFEALRFHDIVIGPVKDNSICLLGMKKFRSEFFEAEINYSNLMEVLRKRNISYKEIDQLKSRQLQITV